MWYGLRRRSSCRRVVMLLTYMTPRQWHDVEQKTWQGCKFVTCLSRSKIRRQSMQGMVSAWGNIGGLLRLHDAPASGILDVRAISIAGRHKNDLFYGVREVPSISVGPQRWLILLCNYFITACPGRLIQSIYIIIYSLWKWTEEFVSRILPFFLKKGL